MEGIAVLHPADKTSVWSKRDDREALDVESSLETVRIDRQKTVDEAEELHDTLVLPEIFVALKYELVVLAVAALD